MELIRGKKELSKLLVGATIVSVEVDGFLSDNTLESLIVVTPDGKTFRITVEATQGCEGSTDKWFEVEDMEMHERVV